MTTPADKFEEAMSEALSEWCASPNECRTLEDAFELGARWAREYGQREKIEHVDTFAEQCEKECDEARSERAMYAREVASDKQTLARIYQEKETLKNELAEAKRAREADNDLLSKLYAERDAALADVERLKAQYDKEIKQVYAFARTNTGIGDDAEIDKMATLHADNERLKYEVDKTDDRARSFRQEFHECTQRYRQQKKELTALREENEQLRKVCNSDAAESPYEFSTYASHLNYRIDQLSAVAEKMVETLRWYGRGFSQTEGKSMADENIDDLGKRARAMIREYERTLHGK